MGKKVKVELNRAGVREMLKSAEMDAIVYEHAQAIQGRCGGGYGAISMTASTRCIALVYPETAEAESDNYKNNTIEKALG